MKNLVASHLVGNGCLNFAGASPGATSVFSLPPPVANRHSLPFGLGRSLALPNFRRLKVGAQFLRHQLRNEVRSMVCFWLRHQLQAKVRSIDKLFPADE